MWESQLYCFIKQFNRQHWFISEMESVQIVAVGMMTLAENLLPRGVPFGCKTSKCIRVLRIHFEVTPWKGLTRRICNSANPTQTQKRCRLGRIWFRHYPSKNAKEITKGEEDHVQNLYIAGVESFLSFLTMKIFIFMLKNKLAQFWISLCYYKNSQ